MQQHQEAPPMAPSSQAGNANTMTNPSVQPAVPPPTSNPFTEAQLKVLAAIADTVVSAHSGEEAEEILKELYRGKGTPPDWQVAHARQYVEMAFTSHPNAMDILARQLQISLSPVNLSQFAMVLTALSTRTGSLLLTGSTTRFYDLTVEQRESVMMGWSRSRLLPLRKLYRGFTGLVQSTAYTNFEIAALGTGFPFNGDPKRYKDPARIVQTYDYEFVKVVHDLQTFDTDILVIGSGAGGGVMASEMARKGHQVMVIEKGTYVPCDKMPGSVPGALRDLYEGGGAITTEDGSMFLLAGSTFGGGTTVNWSASLKPQHYVREEWAHQYGLPYFLSTKFQNSMEYVCKRMGVADKHIQHSKPNQALVDGASKLGYHVAAVPQNTAGKTHDCGLCGWGCVYGEKQGGVVTWLRDASDLGATFMQGAEVERILFSDPDRPVLPNAENFEQLSPSGQRRKAVGALVRLADGKRAIVRARKSVVVSGGSINTPATLLRSGLKGPYIGRGLKLHPATFVIAYFDEEMKPWDGAILTTVSNVVENNDGSHYGAKLEINISSTMTYMPLVNWKGSKEMKKLGLQYNHSGVFLCITRDRDGGRVVIDKDGRPRIEYTISKHDSESSLAGILALCKLLIAAGAHTILPPHMHTEAYKVPREEIGCVDSPNFLAWLETVRRAGVAASYLPFGSAHQMGSCPMGTSPNNSAVDPRGKVWGTEGLYVADASVMPTASGVNPMVTTMSIAHSLAQFLDEDLRSDGSAGFQQAHL